ncbi:class I SAM-dependent DNA methyltransferase [Rubinisphaera margarita]|uniref:class I SAM-dependent DNA methyltransferase n=1 Tax=Rubinisphaera margarita TaxID=2909586 RepID=UPI001EE7D432|nr:DNA methyltransferase [Rubinisphaera margarita]MCG6158316.1 class I SAM-dependent DNA methyltransferase [Rubinisphaera margarita]
MTDAREFISRWKDSGGAEMANSQTFLNELCELLGVEKPSIGTADHTSDHYVFEKPVEFRDDGLTTSQGRIDLYYKGRFILESKQGVHKKALEKSDALAKKTKEKKLRKGMATRGTPDWQKAMRKAFNQAKRYAEAIPDEWPPFLIVVDVGYCIDLYADFTQSGKNYIAFPNPASFRIQLQDLEKDDVQDLLRAIWTDPLQLDPSRKSAKVTRDLAAKLAKLARLLEGKDTPEHVAQFLMRCLFTMFAEDVGLLPDHAFTDLLISLRDEVENFVPMIETLWQTMDAGGFSPILRRKIKQFNGTLFKDCSAIPLTPDQLELLIEAAEAQWNEVEPAIFGTLLERALDPVERHKLGAHYTPRAYVERLVMPTIIEPLRAEWETAYATAAQLDDTGKTKEAVKVLRDFHQHLCNVRVLDPACGSGNFLYVSLELMKRLEGEVLNAMKEFDPQYGGMEIATVDPHQFLGIEINPRAAAITDLVLWIGYLQWHFRTRGDQDIKEPIIRKFDNIENRDAVLDWDAIEPVVDENGEPVTRWDGRTMKTSPVTGEEIPDETARVQDLRYINPRKAEWPKADYIVGNPPFVGNFVMRLTLGDGYTDALRSTYELVPSSSDYVMYWWEKAAKAVSSEDSERFGLITTNSISQSQNRKVVERYLQDSQRLSLGFAIPDHPWVDGADGADVRIAMTVGVQGAATGVLRHFDRSGSSILRESEGQIHPDLKMGAAVATSKPLRGNARISNTGVKLHGAGFIVSRDKASQLGLDHNPSMASVVVPYRNGRDLTQSSRDVLVIDLHGMSEQEVREQFPSIYQHVYDHVKPERDNNRMEYRKRNWWLFGATNVQMREMLSGLPRFISTAETAKHRFFVFLSGDIRPDNALINIGLDDAYFLGVLSSRIHVAWALATGGRLGVGNDPRYNKTRCFETFPFPTPTEDLKQRIRELGEQLDAHRKRQQELHPKLTMTGMYNVLEKLRAGEPLSDKEKTIHEQGLVSVLKQIHDDLDAAVFEAYGWSPELTDEEILEKLVALNHERAAEEEQGLIRWLRPEFQNPQGQQATQKKLGIKEDAPEPAAAKPAKVKKATWPKSLPERIGAIRTALHSQSSACTAAELAKGFSRVKADTVEELLDTLVEVGQARQTDDGRYVA